MIVLSGALWLKRCVVWWRKMCFKFAIELENMKRFDLGVISLYGQAIDVDELMYKCDKSASDLTISIKRY